MASLEARDAARGPGVRVHAPSDRAEFEEFAAQYPPEHRKSAVLHALYLAQEQQGYITGNAARHVAEVIGMHHRRSRRRGLRTT